ncbi:MAG TPA: zinc ribbon domain-containing protein [Xanthomonadaceae bacterium]|jgi:hypothetical protein|nr:zinc ribbon domain-containing protein [Xanthomonadaceae bacterium]
MATCPKCNAAAADDAKFCSACGKHLVDPNAHNGHHLQHTISSIFSHIPHPHIHHRKKNVPKTAIEHQPEPGHALARFNAWLAVKVTDGVGTMWCAYAFAVLAFVSLPDVLHTGKTADLIAWVAQTFLQLVLLSIIIVGQKVAGEASDKRAIDTYNDAEAVLHESIQIQQHLAAQDAFLQRLIDELCERRAATNPAVDKPAEPKPA